MYGIDNLAKAIFNKDNLAECGLSDLQSLARKYPYFAPAHLLLAEKIRTLDVSLYEEQLQKASFYVQQPLWLHYLLNHNNISLEVESTATPEETIGNTAPASFLPAATAPVPDYAEAKIKPEESLPVEQVVNPDDKKQDEPLPVEKETSLASSPTEGQEDHFTPPPILNDAAEEEDEEEEPLADEGDTQGELKIPQLKIEPLKETGKDLLFEPYHTVDYFASQGIKSQNNEMVKDRFSTQLKSFTEWLKAMKKLPENEIEQQMDAGAEQKVQHLATHSIEDSEIVTETMAEVWIKQGNLDKAAEVYRKLSLQNPSKSHYFAAKSESLKTR